MGTLLLLLNLPPLLSHHRRRSFFPFYPSSPFPFSLSRTREKVSATLYQLAVVVAVVLVVVLAKRRRKRRLPILVPSSSFKGV